MESNIVEEKKRNSILKKVTVAFIVIVLLLTFFSKTIYNLLLPEVETTNFGAGALSYSYYAQGVVKYSDVDNVYSKNTWTIDEVNVKYFENVTEGQVLAKVDNEKLKLAESSKYIEIEGLQNQLAQLKKEETVDYNAVNLLQDQINLAWEEYAQIRSGIDADGNIVAPVSGRIENINCTEGETVAEGTKMFEIIKDDSKCVAVWESNYNDSQRLHVGMKVSIALQGVSQNYTVDSEIISQEYDEEAGTYKFTSELTDDDLKTFNIQLGKKIDISYSSNTNEYECIVPKDAVTDNSIYVLSEKDGTFGKEKYVEKVSIEILAEDNYRYAINKPSIDSKVLVLSTNKALEDGMIVKEK